MRRTDEPWSTRTPEGFAQLGGVALNAPTGSGIGRPERSNTIEKVVGYRFLADLTAELLRREIDFEVRRGDVDAYGYDIVIEARGLARHIQLKSSYKGSTTKRQNVSVLLAATPSGCLVWITYDTVTYDLVSYRFLGEPPGQPLRLPEDAPVARHTRPDSSGIRPLRQNHRVAKKESMTLVHNTASVANLLFGPDR